MRAVAVVLSLVAVVAVARAEGDSVKALKPYTGKLVISPEAAPNTLGELPAYIKANLDKDNHYELIRGAPWHANVTCWLAKAAKDLTLVVVDKKADAKAAPLISVPTSRSANGRLVSSQFEATIAAGFAAGATYEVRLVAGKKVLGKAELVLRD